MNSYLINILMVVCVLIIAVICLMTIMSICRWFQSWTLNRRLNSREENPLLIEKKEFPEYDTTSRDSYSILPDTSVNQNYNYV